MSENCTWITKGRIMAIIGIVGGDSCETAHLFLQMYQDKFKNTLHESYKITGDDGISLVCIDENTTSKPNIWIIQEAMENWHPNSESLLVINADSKPIPAYGKALSYGFNGKASVTASSVADSAMQVCVQRGFTTLNGQVIEPQEFKVVYPHHAKAINVLGAVAACVLF